MSNRTETAAVCILVACDRSLCRNGSPLLSNLQALDRLRALGFETARCRRALGGGEWIYVHPQCRFALKYAEYQCADGRYWCIERTSRPSAF